MARGKKVGWGDLEEGDADEDEDEDEDQDKDMPVHTASDNNTGVVTITEYRTDVNGKRWQVTRKVKKTIEKVQVPRGVLERKQWRKFGKCAGLERGVLEPNVTFASSEHVELELKARKREDEPLESYANLSHPLSQLQLAAKVSVVTCQNCKKPGHWTLKCPLRANLPLPPPKPVPNESNLMRGSSAGPGGTGSFRAAANPLHVSNFPEGTQVTDLRDLFGRFGRIVRLFLPCDKVTKLPRTKAFVTYERHEDAQEALTRLNGYGYGNMILIVEWEKKADPK